MRRATVWLVRAGERHATRGTLEIEAPRLVFTPDEGDALALTPVTRARRERGTPVVSVSYIASSADERHVLLYFAAPPPLPGSDRRSSLGSHGVERTAGILGLRAANRRLKPTVREWEAAIRSLVEP